jgi:Zn-dependent protease with chaperone function
VVEVYPQGLRADRWQGGGQAMTRNILLVIATWLVLGASAVAAPDVVAAALNSIGHGTAAEIKTRIFSTPLTVLGAEFRARALEALPGQVRRQQITEGKLFNRVERVAKAVLQLFGREGEIEVVLFRERIPQATLWRGCVLLLSDGLADPLYDAELAGIIAHEVSHLYFMDEMMRARRVQDTTLMRVVELKCDAAAALSLKMLGLDTAAYLKGLQRIKELTRGMSLSDGHEQTHPQLHERAQFLERFLRQSAVK